MTHISTAIRALNQGSIIALPTETVWGIGGDACNDDTVKKLYDLKSREHQKPIQIMVSSIKMAEQYTVLNRDARSLITQFCPGPLSIIVQAKAHSPLSPLLNQQNSTLALRFPNHPLTLEILNRFNRPIASSSANISHNPPCRSVNDIQAQWGNKIATDHLIGFPLQSQSHIASTIVDMSKKGAWNIIRTGGISEEDITSCLQKQGHNET